MTDGGGGSGPGTHPGVVIIELTGNTKIDTQAIQAILEADGEFLGTYGPSNDLAIFAQGYKK
jgi:hypothetical protein